MDEEQVHERRGVISQDALRLVEHDVVAASLVEQKQPSRELLDFAPRQRGVVLARRLALALQRPQRVNLVSLRL